MLAGYKALISNEGPVHAVAATVAVMEDHWAFNAGYGSVLNEVFRHTAHFDVYSFKDLLLGI